MSGESLSQTPLASWHQAHGGHLVEFGGWLMPVQYTSIAQEHQAVRNHAGLFDISHMGRLTFHGADPLPWLESVTTNHVARLEEGQIQYSLMTNERGGVIDDVLVYRLPVGYCLVCNASNRGPVVAQLDSHRPTPSATVLTDKTLATAMIAVQGPEALDDGSGPVRCPARAPEVLPHDPGTAPGRGRRRCQPDRVHRRGRLRVDGWGQPGGAGLGGPARRGSRLEESSPAGSGPATRSASRRRCPFTVTSCRQKSTRLPLEWAGRSSSTRESSWAARQCGLSSKSSAATSVRFSLDADRGLLSAVKINKPDAGHARDLQRDIILDVFVHLGDRQVVRRDCDRHRKRVRWIDILVGRRIRKVLGATGRRLH